jgi:uncharacterized protein
MKKLLCIFVFACYCITVIAQVREIPKPPPGSAISDQANILSAQEEQLLNEHIAALDIGSSNQIGIATVKSLDGGDIEEVGITTSRNWAIGSKERNNGILILIVIEDRKMRIEVGSGLEGAIPDATAGSIIRNDMTPLFREGDYYHGILKAVESLSKAAKGEYNIPRQQASDTGFSGRSIFKFIIIAIVILIFIGRSGGGKGKGGRMMHRSGSDWLGPMILGSMLGGGRSSGGGGFGGGGGGGFGGFGGGGFSGGGASGSW